MIQLSFAKRLIIIVVLLSSVTYLAYRQLDTPILGIDDAHIFLVYGKNIAAGEGIVYNPGGERVEGFSSPLWTMIVTLSFFIVDDPRFLLLTISILILSVAITALWLRIDALSAWFLPGLLLLVWLISSPGFIIWNTITLMDLSLWTSLLILATVVILSESLSTRYLGGCVALLLLCRPEGMLWGLVFIALAWIKNGFFHSFKYAFRKTIIPLVSYIGTLGLLTLFRVWYFGYPLPNTYYAKVSSEIGYNITEGWNYFSNFLEFNAVMYLVVGITIVLAVQAIALMIKHIRNAKDYDHISINIFICSLIGIIALFVPLLTGGDHFYLFRFYQACWPLFVLPLILFTGNFRKLSHQKTYLGFGLMAIVFLFGSAVTWIRPTLIKPIVIEFTIAKVGRDTGTVMNTFFPDQPTVGVIAAGGVALEYAGPIFDVMGLNDLEVAHTFGDRRGIKNHAAFNRDIFLQRRPQLFMPSSEKDALEDWHGSFAFNNKVLKGLLLDSQFNVIYTPVLFTNGRESLLVYASRDYLATLDQQQLTYRVLDPQELQSRP